MNIDIVPLLIELTLKSTVILLVTLLLFKILYRFSAETRHMILSLGFVALLVLPISICLTPKLEVPVEPAFGEISSVMIDRQAKISTLLKDSFLAVATESTATLNGDHQKVAQSQHTVKHSGYSLQLGSTIYISVAGMLLLVLLLSMRSVSNSLQSTACSRNGHSRQLMESIKRQLKINRSITLVDSFEQQTPWTWGLLKPIVALPENFESWSEQEKTNALVHELAHIRRWDLLTIMSARIICCLYWFNPLVWIAYKLMSEEAEKSCDDNVILMGTQSSFYANQLISVANSILNNSKKMYHVPMMARSSALSCRIKAIINPALRRNTVNKKTLLTALTITLLLSIPFGAVATAGSSGQTSELNRDPISLNKVAPVYPKKAFSEGVEGYAVVEYTVTSTGNVVNVTVVESTPGDYFDESSIRAAKQFLYSPRVVDGERGDVYGVQNRFTYKRDFGNNLAGNTSDENIEALEKNGLSDIGDLKILVNGYLQKATPEKAISLLESSSSALYMDNPDFHDLLVKSINAMNRASKNSGNLTLHNFEQRKLEERNGETHSRLADLYIDTDEWKRAFSHLVLAFELGGIKDPQWAKFKLGMVLFNLGRLEDSRLVFAQLEISGENDKGKGLAHYSGEWLRYVNKEIGRMNSLRTAVLKNAALLPAG